MINFIDSQCTGCGICSSVCPQGVISIVNKKAVLTDYKSCMECGACQLNCVTRAIEVESGVGCAAAMIYAALRGQDEATCEC